MRSALSVFCAATALTACRPVPLARPAEPLAQETAARQPAGTKPENQHASSHVGRAVARAVNASSFARWRSPTFEVEDFHPIEPACARAWISAKVSRFEPVFAKLDWEPYTFGRPYCHLSVVTMCAPDIGADGIEDRLVRVRWTLPYNDVVDEPCAEIDQSHPNLWPGEALLIVDDAGNASVVSYTVDDGNGGGPSVPRDFVRLEDGVGLRGSKTYVDPSTGSQCHVHWVAVLGVGSSRVVTSPPECVP